MLHEFLLESRPRLIEQCRELASRRHLPPAAPLALESGIPAFIEQVIATLRMDRASDARGSREMSGTAGGASPDLSEIGTNARRYGRELSQQGYSIEQVVHGYGDVCQSVTAMALESGLQIDVEEFKTLNRCLDNAIAGAVTEFSLHQDNAASARGARASNERVGSLAHELRNQLNTAVLALAAMKAGTMGPHGATGMLLERSLSGLASLIEGSLAEVRTGAGLVPALEAVRIAPLLGEIRGAGELDARRHGCTLVVEEAEPDLVAQANPHLLYQALGNLVQNACKFTLPATEVRLQARAAGDRVLIEIADHCGGLHPGAEAKMFKPFSQANRDRSGVGLGLVISRRNIEAAEGLLRVRDVPGTGCVFSIDLPRLAPASRAGSPAVPSRTE